MTAKRSNVVPFRRRPCPPLGPGTKQDPIVVVPPRLVPMSEGEYGEAVSALAELLMAYLDEAAQGGVTMATVMDTNIPHG